MAYEVLMPQLGLTMEEGTVSSWIKHEGDEVTVETPSGAMNCKILSITK